MSSIREQIVDEIVTLFGATGGPAGLGVHRERTRPLDQEQLPAVVIYFAEEEPIPLAHQQFKAPLVERQLALMIECRAIGTLAVAPDEALDPITVWVTKQLIQNAEDATSPLRQLANEVMEGKTIWLSKEGDQPIAAAVVMFLVKYRTSRSDPTSKNAGGLTS